MGLMVAVGVATTISVTSILETVAVVGAVVSVAGAVTKNKTLSMVGMGLGLVGGVGALASSALGGSAALFSAGTDAAGATGDVAGVGASAAGDATAVAPDSVASLIDPGEAAVDAADPLNALDTTPVLSNAADVGADAGAAADVSPGAAGLDTTGASATDGEVLTDASGVTPAAGSPGAAPAAAAPDASTASATAGAPAGTPAATGTPGTVTASPTPVGSTGFADSLEATKATSSTLLPSTSGGGSGYLSQLTSYASQHPMVAFGAVQGVSSLLSGWTSSLTPAQVSQLNAQAAANQAAANFTDQQTANLQQPKAVATLAPVTGTPQQLVPNGGPGFINQQAQTLVTGKPLAA
jgi:hypothetical protein